MSKVLRSIVSVLACVFLIGVSLNSLSGTEEKPAVDFGVVQNKVDNLEPNSAVVLGEGGVAKVATDANALPLVDNLELYQEDDPASVVTMYMTVRRGNDLENTNHAWAEVNSATKHAEMDMVVADVPKAEAILQVGDERGPLPGEFGYGEMVTNAVVSIRGNYTSLMPQKSFKINLFDGAGEWRGQKTINLNKAVFDPTRVRNKLAYDLMKGMPDIVTMRTQFVHLYVKDETATPPETAFTDYGLFTQIEQPNKRYLKNHLLDRNGQLYKAIMFEFYRHPEQLRDADDPLYDEDVFSTVLEIQGNKDHTKLLEMLDAVNNWAVPIEDTFKKYFDEDNYFTWMAFNILTGNVDTSSENYYLYSPKNLEKWYFIPWDFDSAFRRYEDIVLEEGSFQTGIGSYWGSVLHQRVLMVPEYRQKLDAKMQELLKIMTSERIDALLNTYRPATENYAFRLPDVYHLPVTEYEYDDAYSLIPDEPELNYEVYRESMEAPMPFYLLTPEVVENKLRFSWSEAYDFNAEDVTYSFVLSKSWDFHQIVHEKEVVNATYVDVPVLKPGAYFWAVTATNERGKTQYPFESYTDSNDEPHYGIKYLYISTDGDVLEREE